MSISQFHLMGEISCLAKVQLLSSSQSRAA